MKLLICYLSSPHSSHTFNLFVHSHMSNNLAYCGTTFLGADAHEDCCCRPVCDLVFKPRILEKPLTGGLCVEFPNLPFCHSSNTDSGHSSAKDLLTDSIASTAETRTLNQGDWGNCMPDNHDTWRKRYWGCTLDKCLAYSLMAGAAYPNYRVRTQCLFMLGERLVDETGSEIPGSGGVCTEFPNLPFCPRDGSSHDGDNDKDTTNEYVVSALRGR